MPHSSTHQSAVTRTWRLNPDPSAAFKISRAEEGAKSDKRSNRTEALADPAGVGRGLERRGLDSGSKETGSKDT